MAGAVALRAIAEKGVTANSGAVIKAPRPKSRVHLSRARLHSHPLFLFPPMQDVDSLTVVAHVLEASGVTVVVSMAGVVQAKTTAPPALARRALESVTP
ncbi:hypothetical protein ACN47E_007184 [Coniothyrium glycines]